MNNMFEEIKNEITSIRNITSSNKLCGGIPKIEIKDINFSEETKAKFAQFKQNEQQSNKDTKKQADKQIGKANQKRGNGRSCM